MLTRLVPVVLIALLAGCSSAPPPQKAKEPEKPAEPVTGQRALYYMYPAARTWATDVQGLQLQSINLAGVKSEKGKAGAWQAIFVTPSHRRSRTYTYSVVEAPGNLHQGVFAGPIEDFSGSNGQARPFPAAALKIDSDAAFDTALAKSADYAAKHPGMPIQFLAEYTPRFPDLAWRVIWGDSVASSEYSVFVDASTGAFLEKVR
ncbi:MAG: hypothetical protein ABI165_11215 [Bryobacteraceae bacterium]